MLIPVPGFGLDVGSFITQCEAALMLVAQRIKQITMGLKQLETINPQYAGNLWKEFLMFGFTIGCTQATVTKLDDFINSGSPSNIEKNLSQYKALDLTDEDLKEYLTPLKAKHAFYKILFPKSKNILFPD